MRAEDAKGERAVVQEQERRDSFAAAWSALSVQAPARTASLFRLNAGAVHAGLSQQLAGEQREQIGALQTTASHNLSG